MVKARHVVEVLCTELLCLHTSLSKRDATSEWDRPTCRNIPSSGPRQENPAWLRTVFADFLGFTYDCLY